MATSAAKTAQEWAAKAQTLQAEGKFNDAVAAYDRVLEAAGQIPEVILNRGVVLSAAGRDSEALTAFEQVIKLKPELPGAHCNRGNIMRSSGRPKDAAESYREAVRLDPTMQAAWFGLAHVLNETDQFEEALKAADQAIATSKKTHAPSHNERIFALLKLSRGSEAIRDVDALTKDQPLDATDARARKLYSLVLSQAAIERTQQNKHAEAVSFHERAAAADASFQNLFNYAISLVQNEKTAEALVVLRKAKAVDASNWKVHAAIGTILMQQGDFKAAAEAFLAASKFPETKDDEAVNFNLGVSLMNTGNETDAREPLERATKANRDNWTAQALLGTIYIGQHNYKQAENVLGVASTHALGGKDPSVWYNLGYAQLMNNRADTALASFKRSLELDPESTQAKAAIEALTATPDQIKTSMKSGTIAQMEKELAAEDAAAAAAAGGNGAGPSHDVSAVLDDPLERTKVLIAPQRPHYLRRKSMEGIVMGRVLELKNKFDMLATTSKANQASAASLKA